LRALEAEIGHRPVEQRRAHDLLVGCVGRGGSAAGLERGERRRDLGPAVGEGRDLGDLVHMGARDGADPVFAADLELVGAKVEPGDEFILALMEFRKTHGGPGLLGLGVAARDRPRRPPRAWRWRRLASRLMVVSTIRLSERRISIDPSGRTRSGQLARSGRSRPAFQPRAT
jgi:hypothetical protein